MRIELSDIKIRAGLTADCRTRLTIEFPTEEEYRRRAHCAIAAFLTLDESVHRGVPPLVESPELFPADPTEQEAA